MENLRVSTLSAEASLEERSITKILWYVDGALYSEDTNIINIPANRVGSIDVRVEVEDGAGLKNAASVTVEVSPKKIRDFTSVHQADLSLVNQLDIRFGFGGSSLKREAFASELLAIGGVEDYSDGRYALQFEDSNNVIWMVEITGFENGLDFATETLNFYTEINGPDRTIILRDGALVNSLDGIGEGSVTISNGAIFQVKQ